ncbi:MAG: glycosyltransferase [Oscillospiraceae bacterium]|jgi:glycosyltransferase involved in cell wall biosynthesis|nr:glycosyltransferase [Oscillospiraceae bacterium]
MSAKTICFINTSAGGSHGAITRELAVGASAAGYSPIAAYSRGNPPGEFASVRIGSDMDMRLAGLTTRLRDNHGFANARATRRFLSKLDEIKPDLLHLHNLHGYYINVEMLFSYIKKNELPAVWTLHDCWAFTGHCSHFVRANCDKWRTLCHACPMKREYPASLLLDNSERNYRRKRSAFTNVPNLRIVAPSDWLAENVRRSFLRDYPLSVIPNGVDTNAFTPSDEMMGAMHSTTHCVVKDGSILSIAAPFDERKGFTDIIETAKLLPNKRFILIGLTDKQKKLLPSNAEGYGRINDRAQIIRFCRKASLLLNATYEDTYPTVNMEAIACGTPAVSYNTGGCAEQQGLSLQSAALSGRRFIQTQVGAIVNEKSPAALAEAIAQTELSFARPDASELLHLFSLKHFDRNKAVSAYVDIYKEGLGIMD